MFGDEETAEVDGVISTANSVEVVGNGGDGNNSEVLDDIITCGVSDDAICVGKMSAVGIVGTWVAWCRGSSPCITISKDGFFVMVVNNC